MTHDLESKVRRLWGAWLDRQPFFSGWRGILDVLASVLASLFQERSPLLILPSGAGPERVAPLLAGLLPAPTIVVTSDTRCFDPWLEKLRCAGISVSGIPASLALSEGRRRARRFAERADDLLYVAVPWLHDAQIVGQLTRGPCALLFLEGAQGLSRWSHDFHPELSSLRPLRARLRSVPIREIDVERRVDSQLASFERSKGAALSDRAPALAAEASSAFRCQQGPRSVDRPGCSEGHHCVAAPIGGDASEATEFFCAGLDRARAMAAQRLSREGRPKAYERRCSCFPDSKEAPSPFCVSPSDQDAGIERRPPPMLALSSSSCAPALLELAHAFQLTETPLERAPFWPSVPELSVIPLPDFEGQIEWMRQRLSKSGGLGALCLSSEEARLRWSARLSEAGLTAIALEGPQRRAKAAPLAAASQGRLPIRLFVVNVARRETFPEEEIDFLVFGDLPESLERYCDAMGRLLPASRSIPSLVLLAEREWNARRQRCFFSMPSTALLCGLWSERWRGKRIHADASANLSTFEAAQWLIDSAGLNETGPACWPEALRRETPSEAYRWTVERLLWRRTREAGWVSDWTRYLQTRQCRLTFLERHLQGKDTSSAEGLPCQRCDVCKFLKSRRPRRSVHPLWRDYQAGVGVERIARERGLSVENVLDGLTEALRKGSPVDIDRAVPPARQEPILEVMREGVSDIDALKRALPPDYLRAEIRLTAQAHLFGKKSTH